MASDKIELPFAYHPIVLRLDTLSSLER